MPKVGKCRAYISFFKTGDFERKLSKSEVSFAKRKSETLAKKSSLSTYSFSAFCETSECLVSRDETRLSR